MSDVPTPAPAATQAPVETLPETKTETPVETLSETKTEAPANAAPTEQPALTPLQQFFADLPLILAKVEHPEMWGVELSATETHVPTNIVLTKFLRANKGNLVEAKEQFTKALQWRKEVQPLKLVDEVFDKEKYGGLGYVTAYDVKGSTTKEVVSWNIYGAVKDNEKTFGDLDAFIKWRAALMELSVAQLSLNSATTPIPEKGPDPYQMVQVHDYKNVSFLSIPPTVKKASKKVIEVFGMAYPELLKEKFFVNVPYLMGWVFSAMKLFLSPETLRKFHPLGNGKSLAGELKGWGSELPKEYGGKGGDVAQGITVKYNDTEAKAAAETVTLETAPQPPAKDSTAEAAPVETASAATESAVKEAAPVESAPATSAEKETTV